MNSEKIFKDPDNISRITMCLEFLISNDFENFRQWIKESREIFNEYYYNVLNTKAHSKANSKKRIVAVDDFISFRHVKPFDPDNFDTVEEEEVVNTNSDKMKNEELSKKNTKFIEVLTGSDVNFIK